MEMMKSAPNGGVITLAGNTVESVTVPEGKNITIDLGGFTWSADDGKTPLTVHDATVRIRNGTIKAVNQPCIRVGLKDSAKQSYVTLESDVKLDDTEYCGVFLAKGAHLDTSADIKVKGVEACCIQGNGLEPYFDNTCIVRGGDLIATDDAKNHSCGIYWPQRGSLSIAGGVIEGDTAVEVRAGSIEVTGGTLKSHYSEYNILANKDGWTTKGCALAICQHTTRLPMSAVVTGGIFKAPAAFVEANPQNNPAQYTDAIEMTVSGGNFQGKVESQDATGFIEGGTFSGAGNIGMLLKAGIQYTVDDEGNISYYTPASADSAGMLSDLTIDGLARSTRQGVFIGSLESAPKEGATGQMYYDLTKKVFRRWDGQAWKTEDMAIADDAFMDSERPVQNRVIKDKVEQIDRDIADRYTKAETDDLLKKKQDVITGAASSVTGQNLAPFTLVSTDAAGKLKASAYTESQLGALAGVTSPIQDQIDALNTKVDTKTTPEYVDNAIKTHEATAKAEYATKKELSDGLGKKQDKLVPGSDNVHISGATIRVDIPDAVTVDEALSDTSKNPVQNKAVKAALDGKQDKGDYALKSYVDSKTKEIINSTITERKLVSEDGTIKKAKCDEAGNNIQETYAKKSEIVGGMTIRGECTSAELDGKKKTPNDVWTLSDAREYNQKSYPAGTMWIYTKNASDNYEWIPFSSGVDTSQFQKRSLTYSDRSITSWATVENANGFVYKGTIALDSGVTASDYAHVVFSRSDAVSGNFAPDCETGDSQVVIYSKSNATVSGITVFVEKGSS